MPWFRPEYVIDVDFMFKPIISLTRETRTKVQSPREYLVFGAGTSFFLSGKVGPPFPRMMTFWEERWIYCIRNRVKQPPQQRGIHCIRLCQFVYAARTSIWTENHHAAYSKGRRELVSAEEIDILHYRNIDDILIAQSCDYRWPCLEQDP